MHNNSRYVTKTHCCNIKIYVAQPFKQYTKYKNNKKLRDNFKGMGQTEAKL